MIANLFNHVAMDGNMAMNLTEQFHKLYSQPIARSSTSPDIANLRNDEEPRQIQFDNSVYDIEQQTTRQSHIESGFDSNKFGTNYLDSVSQVRRTFDC